jgi:hypothetical protein
MVVRGWYSAVIVVGVLVGSHGVMADEKKTAPAPAEAPLTLGTTPADEALVDIVALPQYCKKVEPARAAEFDARIAAAIAKQPSNIQALIASSDFQKAIGQSVTKMSDSKDPEDVEFLKMACAAKGSQP